jgi:serine protease Do
MAMYSAYPRWAARSLAALAVCSFTLVPAFGQGEAETLSASFRKATRRVLPAVVTVRAIGPGGPIDRLPPGPYFPGPRGFVPEGIPRIEGGGSGVVIDADKGFVLTNDHLVQGAPRVAVILHDGRERIASQVRRDPKSDLALLVIDNKGLTRAEWGDSDALDLGDWVLAIGHPFGLSDTVTAGIVSGKGRGIGIAMYEDLIQTDAAINPGNSGGPLVNLRGEVVGINAAIKTVNGGYDGVGFAIPAARARRVAAELAEGGRVRRAYLGVQIGPVDRDDIERLGQPGAIAVKGVSPDGPAAEAGLKPGDILLRLEGKPIEGLGALQSAIEVAPIGQALTVTIDRDGKQHELKVVPKEQPDTFGLPEPQPFFPRGRLAPPAPPAPGAPREEPKLDPLQETISKRIEENRITDVRFTELGLRLSEPAADGALAQRFRVSGPIHGLMIVGVEPDGPADRGGLQLGMVITDVGDQPVESIREFRTALSRRPEDRELVVRVLVGSKAEFRVIPGVAKAKPAEAK